MFNRNKSKGFQREEVNRRVARHQGKDSKSKKPIKVSGNFEKALKTTMMGNYQERAKMLK